MIHQGMALLFRQQEGLCIEELKMPFDSFLGSATALASFSLADTQVVLNLGPADTPQLDSMNGWWVGIDDSPARLIMITASAGHDEMLAALKAMGKKATVVCASEARFALRAPTMKRVDVHELSHLKSTFKLVNSGAGRLRSLLHLYTSLWLKPGKNYQALRLASMAGLLVGMLVMNLDKPQARQIAAQPGQQLESRPKAQAPSHPPPQFNEWAVQMQKFGQDNRANLSSLKIGWTAQGQIHSEVELNRERKRVPKGCKQLEKRQASCSTGAVTP